MLICNNRFVKYMALAATAITLSGCAAKTSYMGIAFDGDIEAIAPNRIAPNRIDLSQTSSVDDIRDRLSTPLPVLAQQASYGDKHAQLQLGIRFEEGRGIERDLKKAKKLYRKAASDTQITQTTFIPEGGIIRSETTSTGKVVKGLDEALVRLNRLNCNSEMFIMDCEL